MGKREEKATGNKTMNANRISHQDQCVIISNSARAWKCSGVGLLNYFLWQRHPIIFIRYISVYLYINHLQIETPISQIPTGTLVMGSVKILLTFHDSLETNRSEADHSKQSLPSSSCRRSSHRLFRNK